MTPPVDAPLTALGAAERAEAAGEAGEGIVLALVLDGEARGKRRSVTRTETAGNLGERALEEEVDALCREVLGGKLSPGPKGRDAGTRALSDGTRIYLERVLPVPELIIVGAGHLAAPLSRAGAFLGFRVVVLDDRPDFARAERFPEADAVRGVSFSDPFRDTPTHGGSHVLLVTRGHRYDYECLRILLALPVAPAYIGLIGSRRRVRATFHQLKEEGFRKESLGTVRAPVGLDLGAETPEEIAIAVAAELVLIRRGGTGSPLTAVERVAERYFPDGSDNEDRAE